jgi:hypothetical protein
MWSVQVVVMAWMSRMVFWAAALMARALAAERLLVAQAAKKVL